MEGGGGSVLLLLLFLSACNSIWLSAQREEEETKARVERGRQIRPEEEVEEEEGKHPADGFIARELLRDGGLYLCLLCSALLCT